MKVEFKAKYMQYFGKQLNNQGFSWIRLLVFVLLVGSVAAIAGAIWLDEISPRKKEAEAKEYLGSMNRAQQAYDLEYLNFADSIEKLGVGIKTDTENYSYRIAPGIHIGQNRYRFVFPSSTNKLFQKEKGESKRYEVVMHTALPKKPELKTYVGLVFLGINSSSTNTSSIIWVCESATGSILWESEKPSIPSPNTLTIPSNLDVACGKAPAPGAVPTPQGFRETLEVPRDVSPLHRRLLNLLPLSLYVP